MSDKKQYEVIRKNCLTFEVGEVVELTDVQARRLVNKVKLSEPKTEKPEKKTFAKKSKSIDGGKDI